MCCQRLPRCSSDQSLSHDTYLTNDPAVETAKTKYRRFLYALWRYYRFLRPVDAVVSPNFGYSLQRELAAALEMHGTPFVVMQKENLNAATEERQRVWHSVYKEGRGKFGGRKILVYNEMERDLEVASGVIESGARRNCRHAAARPLSPLAARARRDPQTNAGAAKVLFFFFSRSDKLPRSRG